MKEEVMKEEVMKKNMNVIVIAVITAALLPLTSQAETKAYAKVHLNFGQIGDTSDNGATVNTDNWQLNSYGSRFGLKGNHEMESGLAAIYQLEWEVNPDDDDTKAIEINNRNQYIGLKGKFGQIRIGTHDTPLKMVQGKFDQFGDTLADLKNAGSHDGEHRLANIIAYMGKTGNAGYNIAVAPGESDGIAGGDGPADTFSASVTYESGPVYVGVATDSYDDTGAAAGSSNSLMRLVSTYKMGSMQFGLLYQSGVEKIAASADEEDWLGLSFSTKIGEGNTFKTQYIMVENNAASKTESTLLGIGFDHKLDKQSVVYAMYSAYEDETGGVTGDEITSLSVGMITKF